MTPERDLRCECKHPESAHNTNPNKRNCYTHECECQRFEVSPILTKAAQMRDYIAEARHYAQNGHHSTGAVLVLCDALEDAWKRIEDLESQVVKP